MKELYFSMMFISLLNFSTSTLKNLRVFRVDSSSTRKYKGGEWYFTKKKEKKVKL